MNQLCMGWGSWGRGEGRGEVGWDIARDCLGILFYFFSRGVQNMIFVTNWVADGAPDAKLPRFCTEFRPESNGTSSVP